MRSSRLLIVALAACLFTATGCADSGLAPEEAARLDSLDATGVVEAYFTSGDPDVELHLAGPQEKSLRAMPNYVPNDERVGGVEDFRISGGGLADREIVGDAGYGDIRQFIVQYVSKRRSSIGDPPGERYLFVYTGTDGESGYVRVLSVGTGP